MSDPDVTPQQEQDQDAPPARIDEASRRRPGFDAETGVWITLDDGQDWCFPKPLVRLHYSGTQVGFVRQARFPGQKARFDPAYGRLLAAASDDSATVADYWKAQLAMAAYLLRWNYDLADEEIGGLVSLNPYDAADPANEPFNRIMAVGFGYDGPKVSSAGPGSPSS